MEPVHGHLDSLALYYPSGLYPTLDSPTPLTDTTLGTTLISLRYPS